MKIKALTLDELKELSTSYFESHPTVDVFVATHDGMFFLQNNRGDAAAHARNIGSELYTINRSDLEKKADTKTPVELPEGKPSDKWKVEELKAYLAANGIEAAENDTKATMLKKIELDALAKKEAAKKAEEAKKAAEQNAPETNP